MRICIIGAKGAGKSTLALQIAGGSGIPVIHLDKEFWRPGWFKPPLSEWMKVNEILVSGEHWVIDGNYFDVIQPRLQRADLFVWLKRGWPVYSFRIISRTLRNLGRTRPDVGLPERLHIPHLVGAFTYMYRTQHRFAKVQGICNTNNIPLLILRNEREIRRFLTDRGWHD